jgi:PTH1 family peptidyl-tRNA hydrolase
MEADESYRRVRQSGAKCGYGTISVRGGDEISRRAGFAFSRRRPTRSSRNGDGDGIAALLIKPMTFMNLSGRRWAGWPIFKIDLEDLLIVVDEVQLPLGKLRARAHGSAGGHNGLKSAIAHLGSEFPRLRVGVGRGPDGPDGKARRDLVDHVLAQFDADEAEEAIRMTARAADASEMFITSGIEAVMNAYNGGDPGGTE